MDILFQIDDPYLTHVDTSPLRQAAQMTVKQFSDSVDQKSIAITITDNDTMAQLNHQYRGINTPTDVLSFENSSDPDFPLLNEDDGYLGDIIIAYPVAQAQATANEHSAIAEIILLVVHGTLHLLGFDHASPAQKEAMWAAQLQIMSQLNLAHIQPTEN